MSAPAAMRGLIIAVAVCGSFAYGFVLGRRLIGPVKKDRATEDQGVAYPENWQAILDARKEIDRRVAAAAALRGKEE